MHELSWVRDHFPLPFFFFNFFFLSASDISSAIHSISFASCHISPPPQRSGGKVSVKFFLKDQKFKLNLNSGKKLTKED